MGIRRRPRFAFLLLGWIAATAVARAAPAPAFDAAPPVALRQGQTIDVTVSGPNLAGVASAAVSGAPGVAVSIARPAASKANSLVLHLVASADAALGDRELRLLGPTGVTRPLHLFVSQYPVIAEKEPNNASDQAQEVALPATLVGRMDAPGDVDQFRFNATKGQRLIFDVHAVRIGSKLDPLVTIHAAGGRELGATVERIGGDPVVVFEVPEDGQYRLRLRDLQYRGGGDFEYRILAGQIPYVESILPSSGEPGKIVTARAIGYNLEGGETIAVDLTNSAPGRLEVRAKTSAGMSNAVPFEVTELPQAVESEPNDTAATANAISFPAEISGHVDHPGDIDFFKFRLAYKQAVTLEVLAGRYGSPATPLLQLRNAHGDVMDSNDGTPDADARIVRELDAGEYVASVRDLTFAGGPGHWYRLKIEPAVRVAPDFAVQFLPDAPRLHRGGNVAMWCEVKRLNGFKGEVTLTPEGLPPGVTGGPVTMPEDASGWFTLAASADAALGTAPFRIRASATIGNAPTSHPARPELDGLVVGDAYLTVLEAAPFGVEAVSTMTPQRIEQLNAEIGALAVKLNATDAKFDASLAEWAKKASDRPGWTVLTPATVVSAKGTSLAQQPDGSVLASGDAPPQDEYTVTAPTDAKGITAVRLEVLADDTLPVKGPGAAPNGNFVLTEFKLFVSKDGQTPQPVGLKNASADFSQADFSVAQAIDNNPATGWAIDPQAGRSHTAVFETGTPIGFGEGTTLTFVLEHQSGFAAHLIGRFRLSVTTLEPAKLSGGPSLPSEVTAILATPAEKRSAGQRAALASYFRSINPETVSDRARMEGLRSFVEPYAQIDRLEKMLKGEAPELRKEQERWQQEMSAGMGWSLLAVSRSKSTAGARLQPQPDGSIFVEGDNPPLDTYELTASTTLKEVTAIRLEALPDPRLPGNGPGRADDGGFILTRFAVTSQKKGEAKPQDVSFRAARASFEQEKFAIAGTLDDKDDTGWAILPETGRPAEATFYPEEPISGVGGKLTLILEQKHPMGRHAIGRFRVWVTANEQPDAARRLPEKIATLLKAKGRSPEQQRELDAYFRSIAPSLEPVRRRLADLRAEVPALPFKIEKNRSGALPVPINRQGGFTGDVQITLVGFARGRENNAPASIAKELKLNPLTLAGEKQFGTLTFTPNRREEVGTRMVVLKAEAKVGNETIVEYSPAFPLTIGN